MLHVVVVVWAAGAAVGIVLVCTATLAVWGDAAGGVVAG
jgi:hypothetical protein